MAGWHITVFIVIYIWRQAEVQSGKSISVVSSHSNTDKGVISVCVLTAGPVGPTLPSAPRAPAGPAGPGRPLSPGRPRAPWRQDSYLQLSPVQVFIPQHHYHPMNMMLTDANSHKHPSQMPLLKFLCMKGESQTHSQSRASSSSMSTRLALWEGKWYDEECV